MGVNHGSSPPVKPRVCEMQSLSGSPYGRPDSFCVELRAPGYSGWADLDVVDESAYDSASGFDCCGVPPILDLAAIDGDVCECCGDGGTRGADSLLQGLPSFFHPVQGVKEGGSVDPSGGEVGSPFGFFDVERGERFDGVVEVACVGGATSSGAECCVRENVEDGGGDEFVDGWCCDG